MKKLIIYILSIIAVVIAIFSFPHLDVKAVLYKWQELVGAIIGASAPFMLWWFVEKYQQRRIKKEHLYYLERSLVDQLNTIIDVKKTIEFFINIRLEDLINNVKKNTAEAYSVDHAFFPLFSMRPIGDDVQSFTTGSGYIDNKIGQAYKLSKDLPFIIDDLRQQFTHTMQINREISFQKLNPANVQKQSYIENINELRSVVKRDMLEKNIPIYLKTIVQTRVALNELSRIGTIKWRLKFDPWFRLYLTRANFEKAISKTFDRMEEFFRPKVEAGLGEIAAL